MRARTYVVVLVQCWRYVCVWCQMYVVSVNRLLFLSLSCTHKHMHSCMHTCTHTHTQSHPHWDIRNALYALTVKGLYWVSTFTFLVVYSPTGSGNGSLPPPLSTVILNIPVSSLAHTTRDGTHKHDCNSMCGAQYPVLCPGELLS